MAESQDLHPDFPNMLIFDFFNTNLQVDSFFLFKLEIACLSWRLVVVLVPCCSMDGKNLNLRGLSSSL